MDLIIIGWVFGVIIVLWQQAGMYNKLQKCPMRLRQDRKALLLQWYFWFALFYGVLTVREFCLFIGYEICTFQALNSTMIAEHISELIMNMTAPERSNNTSAVLKSLNGTANATKLKAAFEIPAPLRCWALFAPFAGISAYGTMLTTIYVIGKRMKIYKPHNERHQSTEEENLVNTPQPALSTVERIVSHRVINNARYTERLAFDLPAYESKIFFIIIGPMIFVAMSMSAVLHVWQNSGLTGRKMELQMMVGWRAQCEASASIFQVLSVHFFTRIMIKPLRTLYPTWDYMKRHAMVFGMHCFCGWSWLFIGLKCQLGVLGVNATHDIGYVRTWVNIIGVVPVFRDQASLNALINSLGGPNAFFTLTCALNMMLYQKYNLKRIADIDGKVWTQAGVVKWTRLRLSTALQSGEVLDTPKAGEAVNDAQVQLFHEESIDPNQWVADRFLEAQNPELSHLSPVPERYTDMISTVGRKFHCTRMLILVVNLQPKILNILMSIQNGTVTGIIATVAKKVGLWRLLGDDVTISEVQMEIFSSSLMLYWCLGIGCANNWSWGLDLMPATARVYRMIAHNRDDMTEQQEPLLHRGVAP